MRDAYPTLTLVALLISAILAPPGSAPKVPRSYPVTIDHWHDADTPFVDVDLGLDVVLDNQALRLEGVNAPEQDTVAGKLATKFAEAWAVKHGPAFTFIPSKKGPRAEKYRRLFGSLKSATDGADLASDLRKAGHVAPSNGGKQ